MPIEHAAVCCMLPWFAEPGGCGFSDSATAAIRLIIYSAEFIMMLNLAAAAAGPVANGGATPGPPGPRQPGGFRVQFGIAAPPSL